MAAALSSASTPVGRAAIPVRLSQPPQPAAKVGLLSGVTAGVPWHGSAMSLHLGLELVLS